MNTQIQPHLEISFRQDPRMEIQQPWEIFWKRNPNESKPTAEQEKGKSRCSFSCFLDVQFQQRQRSNRDELISRQQSAKPRSRTWAERIDVFIKMATTYDDPKGIDTILGRAENSWFLLPSMRNCTQILEDTFYSSKDCYFTAVQQEAFAAMIFHKLGTNCGWLSAFQDHGDDIAGYAPHLFPGTFQ